MSVVELPEPPCSAPSPGKGRQPRLAARARIVGAGTDLPWFILGALAGRLFSSTC
ncbi:MAG: hypothetical protein U0793_21460 [Gemmataceae bacterium]